MSFLSTTLRVFIASPNDVPEERAAAAQAIHEWNSLHAVNESVMLLPVRWEKDSTPSAGARPQKLINKQLVEPSDILIGLFWTRLGTSTGIAESGTIEEIKEFMDAGKPTMLYFSNRKVNINNIDINQYKNLTDFKNNIYNDALVGTFNEIDELKQTILNDLLRQVRQMGIKPTRSRSAKLDEAIKITNLIITHKNNQITPELLEEYKKRYGGKRAKSLTHDPVSPGEIGPNGYSVGYTKEGDKVEWIPDDDDPTKLHPMILRRNDNAILAATNEFADVIWYHRSLNSLKRHEDGEEPIFPEILQQMRAAQEKVERKYGKERLRSYYSNNFGWGMLSGKLSALRWVMGEDWDFLDT